MSRYEHLFGPSSSSCTVPTGIRALHTLTGLGEIKESNVCTSSGGSQKRYSNDTLLHRSYSSITTSAAGRCRSTLRSVSVHLWSRYLKCALCSRMFCSVNQAADSLSTADLHQRPAHWRLCGASGASFARQARAFARIDATRSDYDVFFCATLSVSTTQHIRSTASVRPFAATSHAGLVVGQEPTQETVFSVDERW